MPMQDHHFLICSLFLFICCGCSDQVTCLETVQTQTAPISSVSQASKQPEEIDLFVGQTVDDVKKQLSLTPTAPLLRIRLSVSYASFEALP